VAYGGSQLRRNRSRPTGRINPSVFYRAGMTMLRRRNNRENDAIRTLHYFPLAADERIFPVQKGQFLCE